MLPCPLPSTCQVDKDMRKTQLALLRLKPRVCKAQAEGAHDGDARAQDDANLCTFL